MQTWNLSSEIVNETGFIFGQQGEPILEEALRLASDGGKRKVGVVAVANPSALKGYEHEILGYVRVQSRDELDAFVKQAKQDTGEVDAVVFYGLSEYVGRVIDETVSGSAPSQQEWGEIAYKVAKDIRALLAVYDVVYVTCDVIDGDDGKLRLNINPGLAKLILGDLHTKHYVSSRRSEDGVETVIQTNSALALKFSAPRPERKARRG